MDRLTISDAEFLHSEDANRRVSQAIGGVVILDGPIPDFESLLSTLGQRIERCPRFAQRLRVHPFDYDAPQWVDDADFDLAHHVKRVSLPSPGDENELCRLVAEVMAWRLDRSRPLWEIWVVEGLSDGRWAVLLKVHHCIADGLAIAHIVAGLSDGGPGKGMAPQPDPKPLEPRGGRLTLPSLNPIPWMSRLAGTATALLQPSTSRPLSNLRRYGAARASLADIRQVCTVFDVTVADVVLAALTDSYRGYLIRHGQQPSPESLRTLVPGHASAMLPLLPVEEDNVVQQLRVVHYRRSNAKPEPRMIGTAASHVPFPVTAWAVRLLARLPQRGVASLTSNVVGPNDPMHLMGRRMSAVLPIPAIGTVLRTGVAVLSYADELSFGILADFEAMPDVDELARGVETAVRRLVTSSKRRKPARDRMGLSLIVSA